MSRPRTNSIPLVVDVKGVLVPAQLRPPGGGRGCWHVRWKSNGRWSTRATGKIVRFEAEQVARDIVCGKPIEATQASTLAFPRFVEVQKQHYALKANSQKAAKTLAKFTTVWADFNRFLDEEYRGRIDVIQQVTEQVAMAYRDWLLKKESAAYGIKSKIAVLAAAWNRVRRAHPKSKVAISDAEKVDRNPWEAIKGELPELPQIDPVQLDLASNDLERLLDALAGRPVAQLFIKSSLWAAGRLEELTLAQWDWLDKDGYVDIPDDVAKWRKGRVVRLPLVIVDQLRVHRVSGSPYVFAGFVDEYRRLSLRHSGRIKDYNPGTYHLICKHIVKAAKSAGLQGVSHHALRRTAMELSDQGEEINATDESSKNLGTTTKNKAGFYLRKSHGRTFYLRADRLYAGLSRALADLPAVADLLGVEDRFRQKPTEPSTEKIQRLLDEMETLSASELLELERQRAGRRRKNG